MSFVSTLPVDCDNNLSLPICNILRNIDTKFASIDTLTLRIQTGIEQLQREKQALQARLDRLLASNYSGSSTLCEERRQQIEKLNADIKTKDESIERLKGWLADAQGPLASVVNNLNVVEQRLQNTGNAPIRAVRRSENVPSSARRENVKTLPLTDETLRMVAERLQKGRERRGSAVHRRRAAQPGSARTIPLQDAAARSQMELDNDAFGFEEMPNDAPTFVPSGSELPTVLHSPNNAPTIPGSELPTVLHTAVPSVSASAAATRPGSPRQYAFDPDATRPGSPRQYAFDPNATRPGSPRQQQAGPDRNTFGNNRRENVQLLHTAVGDALSIPPKPGADARLGQLLYKLEDARAMTMLLGTRHNNAVEFDRRNAIFPLIDSVMRNGVLTGVINMPHLENLRIFLSDASNFLPNQ
jgi:hypothetical protein